jgi:hypothetical protein
LETKIRGVRSETGNAIPAGSGGNARTRESAVALDLDLDLEPTRPISSGVSRKELSGPIGQTEAADLGSVAVYK